MSDHNRNEVPVVHTFGKEHPHAAQPLDNRAWFLQHMSGFSPGNVGAGVNDPPVALSLHFPRPSTLRLTLSMFELFVSWRRQWDFTTPNWVLCLATGQGCSGLR